MLTQDLTGCKAAFNSSDPNAKTIFCITSSLSERYKVSSSWLLPNTCPLYT
ncbi:MAG: hypothetical protein LRY30_00230 [Gammaproteobacteria bacterium]|nr:hypothetical protein [Gammaproteobacteria bacterium]